MENEEIMQKASEMVPEGTILTQEPEPTKMCSKCGKEKPLSEFYKKKDGKYHSQCKDCIREANQFYRELRKEKQAMDVEKNRTNAVLSSLPLRDLIEEVQRRGKIVLNKALTPRDHMEALRKAGYRGKLTVTRIDTIDLDTI